MTMTKENRYPLLMNTIKDYNTLPIHTIHNAATVVIVTKVADVCIVVAIVI